jgi:riboflavin synthase
MFTGIIDPIGQGHDMRLSVAASWPDPPVIGASIACSGCCLTAITVEPDRFTVECSAETLARTTLCDWRVGSPVNLERALRMGDELGGHVVSGHVDGVGTILSRTPENGSTRFRIRVPAPLHRFIAPKGSVALNGISLTVNEVESDVFGVNIIPHTLTATDLGERQPGDRVNVEIDTLARYVARLAETA